MRTSLIFLLTTLLSALPASGQVSIGAGTSLPSQTGNNGKFLTTNGSVASWGAAGVGSVTSVDMSVPTFLSIAGNPITTSGTLAVTLSGTALPVANGGTAQTAVISAPAASTWSGWDANVNHSANSYIQGYATTATAGATTTLLVGSAETQVFTGSTTQTVLLPVTSTLVLGQQYTIINNSTGVVTVQSSGANALQAMAANTQLVATVILTSGTSTASWDWQYTFTQSGTLPLDRTSGATAATTWTNAANAVTSTSNTIGSGTAWDISTSHTTFSGIMLKLSSTGNNASSTGSVLNVTTTGASNAATNILIANASTANTTAGRGLSISMTGSSGTREGLFVTDASASAGNSVLLQNSATGFSGNVLRVTNASTSDALGISVAITGTTGNQIGIDTQNSGGALALRAINLSTAGGNIVQFVHQHTTTGYVLAAQTIRAGIGTMFDLYNSQAAANGTGSSLDWYSSRTGTTHTLIAKVAGLIDDITAGAYLGSFRIYTAKNAAPTEHLRVDGYGHLITTGTAPGISSCGTGSPSVAGTDVNGRITIGTGTPASCTLTFANAYTTAPACTVGDETTSLLLKGVATTTTLIVSVATVFGNGDLVTYNCLGY